MLQIHCSNVVDTLIVVECWLGFNFELGGGGGSRGPDSGRVNSCISTCFALAGERVAASDNYIFGGGRSQGVT